MSHYLGSRSSDASQMGEGTVAMVTLLCIATRSSVQ